MDPPPLPGSFTLDDDGHCGSTLQPGRPKRRKILAACAGQAALESDGETSTLRRGARRQGPGDLISQRPDRPLYYAPPGSPPGPETLEEALLILGGVARNIVDAAEAHGVDLSRAQPGALGKKVFLTTSYSGWGCAEVGMSHSVRHLLASGAAVPEVVSHSATDCSQTCRKALRSHKADSAPRHVLRDLLERIPAELRDRLLGAARQHRRSITERCNREAAGPAARKQMVESAGLDWVRTARLELSALVFSRDARFRCDRHPTRRCCAAPPATQSDFWLEVAGTTCIAWSTMSTSSWGWLDPSGLPCLVWCYWVLGNEPDCVAHEIVATKYRPDIMIDILAPKFVANSILSSPTFWGLPASRRRRYTVFLHRGLALKAGRVPRFLPADRPGAPSDIAAQLLGPDPQHPGEAGSDAAKVPGSPSAAALSDVAAARPRPFGPDLFQPRAAGNEGAAASTAGGAVEVDQRPLPGPQTADFGMAACCAQFIGCYVVPAQFLYLRVCSTIERRLEVRGCVRIHARELAATVRTNLAHGLRQVHGRWGA